MKAKLLWDFGLLAGVVLFAFGFYLAWRPLGFIVGGLVAIAVCFFGGYGQSRRAALDRARNGGRPE